MTFMPVMSDVNVCPQLDVCLVLPLSLSNLCRQDPCGRDQRSAGRGEEDGERRAAGHHLGAAAHGQTDPIHAVQHAGQWRPGQVRHTPKLPRARLKPKSPCRALFSRDSLFSALNMELERWLSLRQMFDFLKWELFYFRGDLFLMGHTVTHKNCQSIIHAELLLFSPGNQQSKLVFLQHQTFLHTREWVLLLCGQLSYPTIQLSPSPKSLQSDRICKSWGMIEASEVWRRSAS